MLIAAALASCARPIPPVVPPVAPHVARVAAYPALRVAAGTVEVRRGGDWQPVAVGAVARDVTELRATTPALVELSDRPSEIGRLWLKAGAAVSLSDGSVAVTAGEARLSVFGGRDVLVRPGHETPVAARPELADWTLALEEDAAAPHAAAGLGSLETRTGAHLQLASVDVKVTVAGDQAETVVDETFANPTEQRVEGTFRFPLPDGAELIGLSMEIDGHLVEGALVERAKAQKVYEDIVDKMLDPAILEWEQGNVFKLRVFPIEPGQPKRIVIRYLAPLHETSDGWQYVYPTAAPAMQGKIDSFRLALGGKVAFAQDGFTPGRDVVVDVKTAPADALREVRADGTYTAVRVRPDWGALGATARPPAPQRVVIVVDTSRSALEGRALALESLRAITAELGPTDQFAVLACDVACRTRAFAPVTRAAIDDAVAFVAGIEPDGATDLAAAFAAAGALGGTQVVYLGDGVATWGVTEPEALRAAGQAAFAKAPFQAIVLGKGAGTELLADVAGASGGKVVHPTAKIEVQRFALFVAHAAELPRIAEARVAADGEVYPDRPTTLYEGDELVALVRTAPGAQPPAQVTLSGRIGGKVVSQVVPVVDAAPSAYVGARWARPKIAALESASGDHAAEIVKTSLDYGVLSKKTAFLVLESDEMWEKYQLERRQKEEQARLDPKVTGGDLESVGKDGEARLSPDHIQPGDPEIRVPAPADARQVEVVFPFGETKLAIYEPELGAWTVRFLIDKDTPDGTYTVLVRITLADGQVRTLTLPYTVDTSAPTMAVTLTRVRGGVYRIDATQDDGADDARVVEVGVPGGGVVWLRNVAPGQFTGTWRPGHRVEGAIDLRVVVGDRAQNQHVSELQVAVTQ
jgi:hypothetical protein